MKLLVFFLISQAGIHHVHLSPIVYGDAVKSSDEVPWHAVLTLEDRKPFCGGVLVSRRHVLTAGHCVHDNNNKKERCPDDNWCFTYKDCRRHPEFCPEKDGCLRRDPSKIHVFLGSHRRPNKDSEYFGVDNIQIPTEWITTNDKYEGFDIAMLTPSQSPVPSKQIKFINIADPDPGNQSPLIGKKYSVAGFGKTHNTKKKTSILQKGKIEVKPCNPQKIKGGQICGIGANEYGLGVDTCQGDSGGGLYDEIDEDFELVGIVSFGVDDCNTKIKIGQSPEPGVYTNLLSGNIQSWMQEYFPEIFPDTALRSRRNLQEESPETEKERVQCQDAGKGNCQCLAKKPRS